MSPELLQEFKDMEKQLARDIAAMCDAIDDGDDEVLPILADALEEVGDRRAAGLRAVGNRRPHWIGGWKADTQTAMWYSSRNAREGIVEDDETYLPGDVFDRLPKGVDDDAFMMHDGRPSWLKYATRSAAYLALALALVG